MTATADTDILIVGAGLAGLYLAIKLAPRRCIVLSPAPLGQAAASAWAQGGIAAAIDPADSPEQHAADTVAAGAGLVDPAIALLIAREAPGCVHELLQLGVPFDRDAAGRLATSLEAAHSRPRVARVAGDLAGRAIMRTLVRTVRAAPHVTLLEGVRAVALLEKDGVVTGVLTRSPSGDALIKARETVLATGGSGGLFRVTTNPPEARGAALAQAFLVGAVIGDPEFVQFHPTAIDIGADPAPLATEALRGEGSRLVDAAGEPFMHRHHPLADLAPRDVVARAIHREREAGTATFLDCRKSVGMGFPERFPAVFAACMAAGIDPRHQPIPIAPAAHYHMGGIVVDAWGRSTVEGLSACGECASSGAHGANRLASNSLLESAVFAARIASRLRDGELPMHREGRADYPARLDVSTLNELRAGMSRDCGVVRSGEGLAAMLDWVVDTSKHIGRPSALLAARLILAAALERRESRGGHFREDFPAPAAEAKRSFLRRGAGDEIVFVNYQRMAEVGPA